MTSPVAAVSLAARNSSTAGDSALSRQLFLVLAFFALTYAILAGLRTARDFDLGWQLATGRWVAQHHQIPSVDVFSYTAQGETWIYPVGAGLVFYAAYLVGGYALISWIGAAACCGTVALLLRGGSAVSAGIAILAVPLIAYRTAPRADLFTVVLFAAFLSLLWENYRTGRAPLGWLPLLMVAWVNLHFGFVSGLGLVLAYIVTELLETVAGGERRRAALRRLRNASGWLVCTALATLVNPWGWGIYRALLRQERANAQQQYWIGEWFSVRLNWEVVSSSLSLRHNTSAIYVLLVIAIVAGVLALLRVRFGAAILLLGSIYPAVHYVRMEAVFSCIVVVVGAPMLAWAIEDLGSRIRSYKIRLAVASAPVVLLAGLALLRCFDLFTNRFYVDLNEATFGAGLSGWFPARAAEFVEREKLPGEVFNTYNEGGYLTWKLGPQRRVYIDGRDTLYGVQRIQRHGELLASPSDSAIWEQEVRRYNINTVILPLARNDGIQLVRLQDFCNSTAWRPVYLDEVSVVLVRRTPQTDELIRRFPVDCATAPLPARPPGRDRAEAFNAWANAAMVLTALGRNSEALTANGNALSIFPGSSFLHWERGKVLLAMGRLSDSEQEYLSAIAVEPSAYTWGAVAGLYLKWGRIPAAIDATKHTAHFSFRPYLTLLHLGYIYLGAGQSGNALNAFDEAVGSAPRDIRESDNGSFDFLVAQGRSAAWEEMGDLEHAISFQEKAVQLEPSAPEPLLRLAKLYQRQGRVQDADRVMERAATLSANTSR